MDPRIHDEIARKLEHAKASGLINDYLVTWVGFGGQLDPVVRGWTAAASKRMAQDRIAALLSGLVRRRNVRVAAEAE